MHGAAGCGDGSGPRSGAAETDCGPGDGYRCLRRLRARPSVTFALARGKPKQPPELGPGLALRVKRPSATCAFTPPDARVAVAGFVSRASYVADCQSATNFAAADASHYENGGLPALLAHDPEKWAPVFGKDHAQAKCSESKRFNLNGSHSKRPFPRPIWARARADRRCARCGGARLKCAAFPARRARNRTRRDFPRCVLLRARAAPPRPSAAGRAS